MCSDHSLPVFFFCPNLDAFPRRVFSTHDFKIGVNMPPTCKISDSRSHHGNVFTRRAQPQQLWWFVIRKHADFFSFNPEIWDGTWRQDACALFSLQTWKDRRAFDFLFFFLTRYPNPYLCNLLHVWAHKKQRCTRWYIITTRPPTSINHNNSNINNNHNDKAVMGGLRDDRTIRTLPQWRLPVRAEWEWFIIHGNVDFTHQSLKPLLRWSAAAPGSAPGSACAANTVLKRLRELLVGESSLLRRLQCGRQRFWSRERAWEATAVLAAPPGCI